MPLEFSWITIAPPLVSLDDTKDFLGITDTDHDADVTRVSGAAQEAILSMLGAAGDPTWDATTVPLKVAHAILLLTGHYYEHRGDDMTTVDDAAWSAIRTLLAFHRDPTLA